jgi:putative ABC transport system substrate-binding protein
MDFRRADGDTNRLPALARPGLKRAAIMFNPDFPAASTYMPSLRRRPGHSRSRQSLLPFIATQKSKWLSSALGASRVALIVMPDAFMAPHRAPIISAAARNNVPAIYPASIYARDGGLLSYGPDQVTARS